LIFVSVRPTLNAANKMRTRAAIVRRGGKPRAAKSEKIRLLLADDHVLILEGLTAAIGRQEDMRVVARAADGREAIDLWKTHRPDVALLDLRMPKLNGVAVIREIRDEDASARVIVQTTYDTDEEIYQAMRAGARAYLLKDAPLEELLDCIRKVHAGETWIPPALSAKLAARVSGDALTSREIDVLKLLAQGRSNKEIGSDLFIREATVKSHVRSMFTKLHVMSRTEAIAVANQRGLLQL
jgi:two-component system NarL family response regulator